MSTNLLGTAVAIAMAVLLLAFRQLFLSRRRRNRGDGKARINTQDTYKLRIVKTRDASGEPTYPMEEPVLDSTFIEVEEFVAELRAKGIKRRV